MLPSSPLSFADASSGGSPRTKTGTHDTIVMLITAISATWWTKESGSIGSQPASAERTRRAQQDQPTSSPPTTPPHTSPRLAQPVASPSTHVSTTSTVALTLKAATAVRSEEHTSELQSRQ